VRKEVKQSVVHLVRHAEVENPSGILYGLMPGYRLSAEGRRMCKRLARFFDGRTVTVIRSSPLVRAMETAEALADELGVPVVPDERLIESWSRFEGMRLGRGYDSLWNPAHWRHLYNPWRPSWGEPYRALAQRMVAAITDARAPGTGEEAICVSHQLPVWIARRRLEGRRLWHFARERQCALASVTSFTFDSEDVVSSSYAEPASESSGTLRPRH
jgi:broad specificity phosphatase PhoE